MKAGSVSSFVSGHGAGFYHDGSQPISRSISVEPPNSFYHHTNDRLLRSRSLYSLHGANAINAYDRFSEQRLVRRVPSYYMSSRRHFNNPRYRYHRGPHMSYYPFAGWGTRNQVSYLQRTSLASHYPFYAPSDNYIWRYVDSVDRIGAIGARIRELDYERALSNLRSQRRKPVSFYGNARNDIVTIVRFRSMLINKSDNPRRYYGQSYIKHEKSNTDTVKIRYKYLIKSADQKFVSWSAEDQVETGYDLYNLNNDTLPSILNSGFIAEHTRRGMLMDKAGVVPRWEKLKSDYIHTKSFTDNSKQILQNFKKLKEDTFKRLSNPWKCGQYF